MTENRYYKELKKLKFGIYLSLLLMILTGLTMIVKIEWVDGVMLVSVISILITLAYWLKEFKCDECGHRIYQVFQIERCDYCGHKFNKTLPK